MIIAIPTNNTGHNTETPGRGQNAAYCTYVADAGFEPILVPMETDPNVIASIADGLLLAGGIDIDPMYYGLSNYSSFNVDPARDAAERALFHAFRVEGKPIFGVCRGFQLMYREYMKRVESECNYFDYEEHMVKHAQTSDLNTRRSIPSHFVRANTDSLFGLTPEKDRNPLSMVPVNSMHHQVAVLNFGQVNKDSSLDMKKYGADEPVIHKISGFELVAWSLRGVRQPTKGTNTKEKDINNHWCIIEAMKINDWGAPIMGVQWHPEELKDIRLIRNFFKPKTIGNVLEA